MLVKTKAVNYWVTVLDMFSKINARVRVLVKWRTCDGTQLATTESSITGSTMQSYRDTDKSLLYDLTGDIPFNYSVSPESRRRKQNPKNAKLLIISDCQHLEKMEQTIMRACNMGHFPNHFARPGLKIQPTPGCSKYNFMAKYLPVNS